MDSGERADAPLTTADPHPQTRSEPAQLMEQGDAELIAADPGLPGLRDVLQPARLMERVGWDFYTVEVRYVRYKPGTSVVAGLAVTGAEGEVSMAQAFAYATGRSDKLSKVIAAGEDDDVGRGVLVTPELAAGIADATSDRHLPGVRRFLRNHPEAQPLVYKPGRRWVARIACDGEEHLVKIYRPETIEDLKLKHRALHGLPVPEVLRFSTRGTVTSRWVPGTPLNELVSPQRSLMWRRAGELLARVHAAPAPAGLRPAPRDKPLTAAVHALRTVAPRHIEDALRISESVRAGLPEAPVCVSHGDFSADQVIARTDGDLALLDLDRVGLDDPHADLASWFGAALAAGEVTELSELDPLLEGYEADGGQVDPARLRLHCARAVLQRAAEPFRQHCDRWPDEIDRLMHVALKLTTEENR